MKMLLSEQEVRNIIASQSLEDIKLLSEGKYKKWDVQCSNNGDGLELEYKFDDKGNFKDKFDNCTKDEGDKKC